MLRRLPPALALARVGGAAAGVLILVLSGLSHAGCKRHGAATRQTGERMLMGTRFSITVESTDSAGAAAAIEAAFEEVARVEDLLSEWRPTSEISEVNRRAGLGPVRVGPEMLEVASRAAEIAEATAGAFDISFAACAPLWSFREKRVPEAEALAACSSLVDWRAVEVDPLASTIRLARRGMRIGIAGIGKGYGVDRAAEVLRAHGLTSYLVDGGGDLRLAGGPWRIGVEHPREAEARLGRFELSEGAVVSSGDSARSFEENGVRYHHVLDPRTGWPARGVAAVTLIAQDATTADALATGLFVLGPERGLELAERLPGVEALFVTEDLRQLKSSGFPDLLSP